MLVIKSNSFFYQLKLENPEPTSRSRIHEKCHIFENKISNHGTHHRERAQHVVLEGYSQIDINTFKGVTQKLRRQIFGICLLGKNVGIDRNNC